MADRHTDDDRETNRRTFLKTAAATVAVGASAAGAVGNSVAQSASDYETIEVSGLEVYDLHDDFGGTLENVLFDQTADNSCVQINAYGSGTIRNVGVRGVADRGGSRKTLRPSARGSDDHLLIENVYLGDGATPGTDHMGIYVEDAHAGVLTFRNVHVGHYSDNGLYAADPGYDIPALDPAHGEVHIEESYAYNNNISGFRIGTNGSYIQDCVSVVDSSSDVPVHSNGGKNGRCVRFHNVSGQHAEGGTFYNDQGWLAFDADDGGSGEVRDASVLGSIESPIQEMNCTELSEGDVPQPPAGVPMSAEAAASGQGGGTAPGDGDSGDEGDEEDEDPLANRFVVMSTTANEEIDYRFWVDGDVTLETGSGGQIYAEAGDDEVSQQDGLAVVTGSTGNEYGDAFDVDGDVLAFQRTAGNSDYQLLDDGEDVTDDVPEELPDDEEENDPLADRFVVMSTTSNEELDYQFWVDGDAGLATDTEDGEIAAESGDESVTEEDGYTVVTGSTGNQYGDAFEVNSHVAAFQRTAGNSDYQLLDDGEDVTDDVPEQLPDDGDESDEETTEVTVIASTSGEHLFYRLVADGPIEPLTDSVDSDMVAEPDGNDETFERDDGLYEATGKTGNQLGDSYAVAGEVLMFARTDGNSDWTLLADGENVTDQVPEQLDDGDDGDDEPAAGTLLIDGTVAPDETSRYTFSVTGTVEYDADRSSTVDDGLAWDRMQDVVSEDSVTGIVGNGVDAYAITGELENIDVRGSAEHTIEWE